MSKDPAFLFYSSDFLSGVQDLTMEERGQYITLLCIQHQKGRLTEKVIKIAVPNVSQDVLSKFNKDEDGLYFNPRLEKESDKRAKHAEKQRQRAIEGWKKRKNSKGKNKATEDAAASDSVNATADAMADATALPLENENENESRIKNKSENALKEKLRKKLSDLDQISFCLDNDEFLDAWHEWSLVRKRKRASDTKQSRVRAANKIVDYSGGDVQKAIAVINQSSDAGWSDLYELKGSPKPSQSVPKVSNPKGEKMIRYRDQINPTIRQCPESEFYEMQERDKAGGYIYTIVN